VKPAFEPEVTVSNSKNGAVPDAGVVASAREASLCYVTDGMPGITRLKRKQQKFDYIDPRGKRVRDSSLLDRIRRLAIPPAWEAVWICPREDGHLQATGRDARGRKQFRYHEDWRKVRDATKYDRMIAFGRALPRIRRRVTRDLARRGLPREKVLATVVRLLETTLIRVGNTEYARANNSYGLTTFRDRHVNVSGSKINFYFRGKSGKRHVIKLENPRLAKIVRQCRDLPGYELFQYVDETGGPVSISSNDVNDYLREITGAEFTAKDFRTWAGTVLAARAFQEFKRFSTKMEAKHNILKAVEAVARMLGNTPAICRRCYVHPVVLDTYLDGTLVRRLKKCAEQKLARDIKSLRPEEAAVLMLLQGNLKSRL
jgi:DNA topoisomerase-1